MKKGATESNSDALNGRSLYPLDNIDHESHFTPVTVDKLGCESFR